MCLSDDLPHRCGSGFGVMGSYGISHAAMESDGFLFGLKGHETERPSSTAATILTGDATNGL